MKDKRKEIDEKKNTIENKGNIEEVKRSITQKGKD